MTSADQLPDYDKKFIASFWNNKIIEDRLSKEGQYSSSCRDIRRSSQDSSLSSFEESMTSSRDTIPSTKTFHLRNIALDSQPRPLSDTRYDKSSKVDYETMKMLSLDRQSTNMQSKSISNSIDKVAKIEKDIRRTQSDAELVNRSKRKHSFKSFSIKRAISPLIFRQKKNQKVETVAVETSTLNNVKTKIKKSESVSSIPVIMETGFPATSTNNIHRMTSPTGHDSPCIRGLVSPLVHPRNSMNFPTPLRPRNSVSDTPEKPKIIDTRIMRLKYQPLSPKKTNRVKNVNQPTCVRHQPIIKSRSPQSNFKTATPLSRPIIKTDTLDPVFSDPKPISEQPPKHIKPIPPSIAPKPKLINSTTLRRKCIECNNDLRRNSGEHLAETLKPLREEMLDILKEYDPNKNIDTPVLRQKLKEIKKELEEYKSSVVPNEKINNIREQMKQRKVFGSDTSAKSQYSDEVFLRTDRDMLSPSKDKESSDDYYKEIEVRINPEGIAVVRRRHKTQFENNRSDHLTRRSTIHVDDRVFCDKAVLHSIYGHDPSHVKGSPTTLDRRCSTEYEMNEDEIKIRPFIHQKSVPNLSHYPSCTHRTKEEMEDCPETDRLKVDFNKNKTNHLPIHKKYIKAYSKFYERKLALKLLDLNKFIKEEKDNKVLLDEKIKKSFMENDKLIHSLNLLKKDILSIIEDIETPV